MRLQGVSLPRTNQRQTFVCGMQLATGVMQGKDGCAPGPRQEEAWCTRCRGGARQGAACCRACRAAGRAEEAVHAERLGCSSSEGSRLSLSPLSLKSIFQSLSLLTTTRDAASPASKPRFTIILVKIEAPFDPT
ncbi:hypothetical protein ACLB2K_072669 [Fragaria x ananassa]